MGNARSLPPPASDDGPYDAAEVAARQSSFNFFESLDPGSAFRWSSYAYFLYKRGGGADRARPVLRAAVTRCADYGWIYSSWVTMEASCGVPAAARELFEEWRARIDADGGGGGGASKKGRAQLMWTRYISFELEDGGGGADRVRAVAAAAVAACPRNVEVRGECVLAEVKLGDDERARAAFDRALADFAGDDEARRELTEEVRRRGAYLSEQRFGGCSSFCRGWWFRPYRWWEQI